MRFAHRTESQHVEAFEFDGTNQQDLERRTREHAKSRVEFSMTRLLDLGHWVVLQPHGRWAVMDPERFQRTYVERKRPLSCFDCTHYALVEATGRCSVFDEQILSEVAAAADCLAYEES